MVGDSGVGKTALLLRFIDGRFEEKMASTVGVDFAVKRITLHDTHVKVQIWDTAGQERFRTLTSTFYRGAKGIIFVYDVTRRETLESLEGTWLTELEAFAPAAELVKMVVANKVDVGNAREVSWNEGCEFARRHGCLYCETSAKQNIAVGVAFEELVLKILETPSLLESESWEGSGTTVQLGQQPVRDTAATCYC